MMRAVLLSVSCLMVFSCRKEVIPETYTDNEIALFPKSIDGGLQTKAVTTLSTLESNGFRASATTVSGETETQVWTNSLFTKSGELFKGGRYWPATNRGYRFYGSSSALTFTSSGNTVTVPEGNTADVVCAYKASSNYMTANSLDFHHILSKITTVRVNAESPCTISNITISLVDAKTGGVYNLRSGAWSSKTPASSSNRQLYRNAGSVAAGSGHTGSDNDYVFVPGSYYLQATWTATVGAYTKTYTNKLSTSAVTFAAENQYSVTANLSGDPTKIEFAVSVEPWGSNTVAIGTFPIVSAEDFEINGDFTVNGSGKKVRFAKGNLQAVIGSGPTDTYNYTASSWKFADNQWDYIGNAAGNTTFAVGSTVDLFGWVGESADYDSYGLCTNTGYNNAYYGTSGSDALKTDWGSIPGIETWIGSGWRTLTKTEWNYLFTQRTNASSLYGQCQITTASGTVTGMLILPDNWTNPSNCTVTPGTGAFDRVTYSATAASGASNAWCDMEAAGVVFLPAAGIRDGVGVSLVGSRGFYWSSSVLNEGIAYDVVFYSGNLYPQRNNARCYGFSVRLVR